MAQLFISIRVVIKDYMDHMNFCPEGKPVDLYSSRMKLPV